MKTSNLDTSSKRAQRKCSQSKLGFREGKDIWTCLEECSVDNDGEKGIQGAWERWENAQSLKEPGVYREPYVVYNLMQL